jgi:hypothetical protein
MPLALSATNLLSAATISKFIFGVDDVTLGGILTTQEITALELAANAASAQIQKYCDFTFVSGSYTEVWDGAANDELIPREAPVTAITSLKFAANGVFTPESIIPAELYCIGFKGSSVVLRNGMLTPRGRGNVELIYTAGYATIPADLQLAALRQLQYLYKQIGKGDGMLGLKMISKMNEAQSKDDSLGNSGLITEVEGMLKSYHRFECSNSVMFTRVT